jgi:hypothetical protein
MLITCSLFMMTLLCVGTCSAASVYAVSTGRFLGTLNLDTGAFNQIGAPISREKQARWSRGHTVSSCR